MASGAITAIKKRCNEQARDNHELIEKTGLKTNTFLCKNRQGKHLILSSSRERNLQASSALLSLVCDIIKNVYELRLSFKLLIFQVLLSFL